MVVEQFLCVRALGQSKLQVPLTSSKPVLGQHDDTSMHHWDTQYKCVGCISAPGVLKPITKQVWQVDGGF